MGWNGLQQFQSLATKRLFKKQEIPDPRYLEAEKFTESVVGDFCQMKVSRDIRSMGMVMLGEEWKRPGNEDTDRVTPLISSI